MTLPTGPSRRLRIIEEGRRRLQQITKVNGFWSDAGLRVYLGVVPQLGESDPPFGIALTVGEDQLNAQQLGKYFITLPLNIVAFAKPDIDEPWLVVEQLLTDIKVVFESDDPTFGGLIRQGNDNSVGLYRGTTEVLERRSGTDVCGVMVSYGAPYTEAFGNPAA